MTNTIAIYIDLICIIYNNVANGKENLNTLLNITIIVCLLK